ncbi:MAG: TIGR02757 family protein [Paludibacter sp.]|nr:TIGR02757 family protein [Paludibacter sp.]
MIQEINSIKALLNDRYKRYNNLDFIETDPIQIPHQFNKKEDIEIAGFLAATIAWGQRISIIKNANKLIQIMDNAPYDFIMETDFSVIDGETPNHPVNKAISNFVHRTFNGCDLQYFLRSLQNIYKNHGGLETVFTTGYQKNNTVFSALSYFRNIFLELNHEKRVAKHLSDVTANSSAKRLNMYLRWMVRQDENEVDFGIWKHIPASALMLPLDVHTGDVGRALGILQRRQNDWKAVEEITSVLQKFDPDDPIKYDYALFGIGAFENKKEIF